MRSETGVRSDAMVVQSAELRSATGYSLYEALTKLRPEILRGTIAQAAARPPVLYVDGMRHGDLTTLQLLPRTHIHDVVFLRRAEALVRYGHGHEGGAILVRLIRP